MFFSVFWIEGTWDELGEELDWVAFLLVRLSWHESGHMRKVWVSQALSECLRVVRFVRDADAS